MAAVPFPQRDLGLDWYVNYHFLSVIVLTMVAMPYNSVEPRHNRNNCDQLQSASCDDNDDNRQIC